MSSGVPETRISFPGALMVPSTARSAGSASGPVSAPSPSPASCGAGAGKVLLTATSPSMTSRTRASPVWDSVISGKVRRVLPSSPVIANTASRTVRVFPASSTLAVTA